MPAAGKDLTTLLVELKEGKKESLDELMPLVYAELRRMARGYMSRERPDHTLQATALVNEAYMRLVGQREIDWRNREQFFGMAAQMMRRILINHAEAKHAGKRGGHEQRVPLDEALEVFAGLQIDLIGLNDALDRLALMDARQAQFVEMQFFTGLKVNEIAEVTGLSPATVKRELKSARTWLFRELSGHK